MSSFYSALMKSNDSNMVSFICPLHQNSSNLKSFDAFIVYMSTVNNVSITFGCFQFVSHKSRVYTCINIYAENRYIYVVWNGKVNIIRLMEHNANHIIPLYCHLPVSCRSLVDRCGSLGSCKPQI